MAKLSTSKKIAENEMIKIIEENQPISIYALYKKLPYLSYSGVHDYIELLEAKKLVKSALRLNKESSRSERVVFIGTVEIGGTI